MTDNNLIDLTNEDIISSLKIIATTRNCNECKIRNCEWGTCNCEQITANAALNLFTRQQAKIERLEKEAKDKERAYNDEFCLRKEWKTKYQGLLEEKQTAKSKTYKEFAEKLKEFMHNKFKALDEYEFEYITERDIDNLLKETEGKV